MSLAPHWRPHLSEPNSWCCWNTTLKEEEVLQTCFTLFFSVAYLARQSKGRNKTLALTTSSGLCTYSLVKAEVLPVEFFWLHKILKRVDIGCIKCKITISLLKGCFRFEASSLKQFVSLLLYSHVVQLTFFLTFCSCPKLHSSVLALSLAQLVLLNRSHKCTSLNPSPSFIAENHSVSFHLFISRGSQPPLPRKFPSSFLSQFSKRHLSTPPRHSRQLPYNSGHFLLHTARAIKSSWLCQYQPCQSTSPKRSKCLFSNGAGGLQTHTMQLNVGGF